MFQTCDPNKKIEIFLLHYLFIFKNVMINIIKIKKYF
jgi:hypothetical protein